MWKKATAEAVTLLRDTKLVVTAPKVSVRMGTEILDIEPDRVSAARVREAVMQHVLPKFVEVTCVTGDQLRESDVLDRLYDTVDELARSVTVKFEELLPCADVREKRRSTPNRAPSRQKGL